MLRNIRLKNFVHFYEDHFLSFNGDGDGGSFFFMGPNESGKSCMFEAIRRCMSTSKSWGMSSCHKPDEYSFVVCEFRFPDEKGEIVFSGVVRLGSDWPAHKDSDGCIKFVRSRDKLLIDLVKKAEDSTCNVDLSAELEPKIKEMIGSCLVSSDLNVQKLQTIIETHIKPTKTFRKFSGREPFGYSETECERYLLENIDPAVVITYPVRSIAAAQWTKSPRFNRESRPDNRRRVEQELRDRSEIFSWYFTEHDAQISGIEKKQTEYFFRKITNNNSFTFEFNENIGQVIAFESKSKKSLSIDKVPEGFFEAQNCSILLAINRFKTICLEEAGRGMHPQMIERFRDLVLKKITNKVIITTSHIPTFLAEWNLPQVLFFRRQHEADEDQSTFKVVSGEEIVKKGNNKISRMLAETMFFASRILFVEGDHDRSFILALKSILLDEDDAVQECIDVLHPGIKIETFRKFLSSLQVISLDGHENKRRYHEVCNVLLLEHYFLFDHDVVFSNKILIDLALDFDLETIQSDVTCLEKKGVIVWREMKKRTRQATSNQLPDRMPYEETDTKLKYKDVSEDQKKNSQTTYENIKHSKTVYASTSTKRESGDDMSGLLKKQKTGFSGIEYVVINLHEITIDLINESAASDNIKTLKQVCEENNVPLNWEWEIEKAKKYKLFKKKSMTKENVFFVVKKILECCRLEKTAEMSRLLKFLLHASIP